MSFPFYNWPLPAPLAFSSAFLAPKDRRSLPPRRPDLISRWRCGPDGQLECRWEKKFRHHAVD
jgi:hypothetical protein